MHETNPTPYPFPVPEAVIQHDRCPACRYELGATEQQRCPECGRVPREVLAERAARRDRLRARTRLGLLLAIAFGLAVLKIYIELEERRELRQQQQPAKIYMLTNPERGHAPATGPELDPRHIRMEQQLEDGAVRPTPLPDD